MAHVVTDRSNRRQRRLDVELGSGQHLAKGAGIERTATQIDPGDHPLSLGRFVRELRHVSSLRRIMRSVILTVAPPAAGLVSVHGVGGLVRLALVVVVCAGLAAVINRWGHLGHGRDDLLAALRACLQLVVVGLLIAAVLGSWWLTLGFIILMLSVASLTAGRRLTAKGPSPRSAWWFAVAPVVLGAVPVAGGLMLSGLIPARPSPSCRSSAS